MRVSVFGLGYVGCVSAACFARAGHEVVGVDVSPEKVALINAGTSPIVEPGLADLLAEMVATKHLRATCSTRRGRGRDGARPDLCGNPLGRGTVGPTSRRSRASASKSGEALRGRTGRFTVVLRSTVLPGTLTGLLVPALRAGAGPSFAGDLARRRQPGIHAGRLVAAGFRQRAAHARGVRDAKKPPPRFDRSTCASTRPLCATGVAEAEMIKYVSNAFHALKVCFANEIGDLCAALGADAQEVTRIFLMDKKLNVSEAYLRPGFAFGGSCLPKDVRALVQAARSQYLPVPLARCDRPVQQSAGRAGRRRGARHAPAARRHRRSRVQGRHR